MRQVWVLFIALVSVCMVGGLVSCKSTQHSAFADQAIKPVDLVKIKYRTLKSGAVGESIGFNFSGFPLSARTKRMPNVTCLIDYKKKESTQRERTWPTQMPHQIGEDSALSG